MKVVKYIPNDTLRRSGQKILGTKFIVIHDTGNKNSSALQNVDYYIKSSNVAEQSAHAFVDDISVIECIPHTEKAWHVRRITPTDNNIFGLDANDYALGIELCYFDDLERSRKAYKSLVKYIKELCVLYDVDPSTHVTGHHILDAGRKSDPMNAFNIIEKTWDDFLKDILSGDKEDIRKQIHDLVDKL